MKVLAAIGCVLQVAEVVELGGDLIAEGLGIGIRREHERGVEDESELVAVFSEGAAVEFDGIAGEAGRLKEMAKAQPGGARPRLRAGVRSRSRPWTNRAISSSTTMGASAKRPPP